jgi:hypothetical protein
VHNNFKTKITTPSLPYTSRSLKVCFSILLLAMCFLINSCALVFNGTRQNVLIKSMTKDSKIYVDGNYVGKDSVAVKLKRADNHNVIVKKDGYDTEVVAIDNHIQIGWLLYDIIFNQFAIFTDAPTGAWYSLDKKNIIVDLNEKKNKD